MPGTGDIRAGKAFVEAYLDSSKLTRGLKGIQGELARFGAGINALGTKFMALGAGIVTPLLAATKHFADVGSKLNDMAARTGLSTNALSELGFAAEQSGASLEDVETGVRKMQKAITEATKGPLKQLQGMAPEQQFMAIADSLTAIKDPSERAAKTLEVFGKSGTKLLPMLGDLKGLRAEAVRLGLSMGPEQAAAADALGDAWDKAKASFKGAAVAIGSALAPTVTSLAGTFTTLLGSTNEWLSKHGSMVQAALRLGVALGALGVTMKVLGFSMTLLAAHPLVAAFTALGVAAFALAGGLRGLFEETKRYDDAASRALAKGDSQRVATRGLASELESLSKETRLGADQQTRAQAIIAELTKTYGDLGLSVNEATGQIEGFDAAQTKLNESMSKTALRELEASLSATESEIKRAYGRIGELRHGGRFDIAGRAAWALGFRGPQVEAELETIAKAGERAQVLRNRIRDLQRGGLGGLAPQASKLPPETGGTAAAAGFEPALRERLNREANERGLEMIDDEERRAIAATHQKWNAELAAAQRTTEEKKAIAREEEAEIAAIHRKYAAERAIEQQRLDVEAAARRQDLADQIVRAEIETTMRGRAKEIALLELERRKALREPWAWGAEAGDINRLFDLKRKGIDLAAAMGPRASVRGTFSASAVAGLAQGIQERIARTTERHLPRIARGIDRINLQAAP